jgi:hypothetical protein
MRLQAPHQLVLTSFLHFTQLNQPNTFRFCTRRGCVLLHSLRRELAAPSTLPSDACGGWVVVAHRFISRRVAAGLSLCASPACSPDDMTRALLPRRRGEKLLDAPLGAVGASAPVITGSRHSTRL